MRSADVVVVGGGVVGLATARALRARGATVAVLEKEPRCGQHASGRNSGVLHAGFYYGTDSMKARFSAEGNRRMAAFCDEEGLPIRRTGKLVVARSEAEHAGLDALLARGRANGVAVEAVDEVAARALEPRARTAGRALYSPSTAVVDPSAVMERMAAKARAEGVSVRTATRFLAAEGTRVQTDRGDLAAGFVVNAAGLYADVVARSMGAGQRWRIVPFEGLYVYGDVPPGWLRMPVYPVPDLGMPFLGVHFTVTVDGHTKIGPTAIPAPWREHYGGLGGFAASELADVVLREACMLRDPAFRRLALREGRKISRWWLAHEAGRLVDGVRPRDWRRWGRPGVRAQLVDAKTGALEMDFVVERTERALHVLNAVSPAFTCALPLADHLASLVG